MRTFSNSSFVAEVSAVFGVGEEVRGEAASVGGTVSVVPSEDTEAALLGAGVGVDPARGSGDFGR